MKKNIIFLLLAVLTVSFASTGFAKAKKAAVKAAETKKESAKPAAIVNPLLGTWSFNKGLANLEIKFTADTAVFTLTAESGNADVVEMKYKFSKSPLILEYKAPKGKTAKLSMKYAIKGDKLTYRFLDTKNKPVPGLSWEFSQERVGGSAEKKDADTVAEKRRDDTEAEKKDDSVSDNPFKAKDADKKSADIVLVKGLKVTRCAQEKIDEGKITFSGLEGVELPVKKGKFDLILPSNPVFGESSGPGMGPEINFGSAKVYSISYARFFSSGGPLPFVIIFSETDVSGTVDGKAVKLKKGWNIIGDKKQLTVRINCPV